MTVEVKVSPNDLAGVELLEKYGIALNHALNKTINLKTIKDVHEALYREPIEWSRLSFRVAVDCYRDALAIPRELRGKARPLLEFIRELGGGGRSG